MLSWFQALLPREDKFFDLFQAHAAVLVKGAAALGDALEGGPGVASACDRIIQHEHEADDVAREVLFAVRRSFITPFDRSDIRGLANSLDDTIDQMQKTAKTITLFELAEFSPQMRALGAIAIRCGDLTVEAVSLLAQMRKNHVRLNDLTAQVAALESESDAVYDDGMKALFEQVKAAGGSGLDFIMAAQVYDHLEKVVDRFEDVANRINGILVENL